MDWFLYNRDLRQERVEELIFWTNNLNYLIKKPLNVHDVSRSHFFRCQSLCNRNNESGPHSCHKNLTGKEHLKSST